MRLRESGDGLMDAWGGEVMSKFGGGGTNWDWEPEVAGDMRRGTFGYVMVDETPFIGGDCGMDGTPA